MQSKYRPRESSLDARPFRVPPVPVIKLGALASGKYDSKRSPTFGTFSTNTSFTRPPRGPLKATRSSTQRRSRVPRTEQDLNQDFFMFEEYRKSEIMQARHLPCPLTPYWYIDKVQDESELLTKGLVSEHSSGRSGLTKWVSVTSTQDMSEVLKARKAVLSDTKISLYV